jgi:hypothetical protein
MSVKKGHGASYLFYVQRTYLRKQLYLITRQEAKLILKSGNKTAAMFLK